MKSSSMSRKMVVSQARLAPGYMLANFSSTNAATAVAFLVSTGGNMPALDGGLVKARRVGRSAVQLFGD